MGTDADGAAGDLRWRREHPLLFWGAVALSMLLFASIALWWMLHAYTAALLHPDYDAQWRWLPWLRWALLPLAALAGAWLALRGETGRALPARARAGATGLGLGAIAGLFAVRVLIAPALEAGLTLANQGLAARDERPALPCTVTRHFEHTSGLWRRRPPRVACRDGEGRSWTVPVEAPERLRPGTHCRLQLHRGRLGLAYFGAPPLARCIAPA